MVSADERREALKGEFHECRSCTRCPQLAATRQSVVFGSGNADADLMFIGEAPGANEDRMGLPFVGQAGKLLDQLLGEIGLARQDVFIANVLKCLRSDAHVQLGDGSWERIDRLVADRYSGTVMSVADGGGLVPRRVTGWHATPLGGRSVHRLTFRSSWRAGAGRGSVDLTGDHPVLTDRGYVRVDALRATDRVATGQGLSAVARDVVIGTLLGDGSLNESACHLSMSHSDGEQDYARFKASLLAELEPRVEEVRMAAVGGHPGAYGALQVRTAAHRGLRVLGRHFYRPSKVVPDWVEHDLNARSLAIWFMDHGSTRLRGGRGPVAEIATGGFGDRDRQVLLRALGRLGLPAKAGHHGIYFDVATSQQLAETIAPFVPPSMRHKLDPDVEAFVPFDPSRFDRGEPEVLYDHVELDDITDRVGTAETFFCIDVEETHNFVTAGGVVHNCRPPANRDPQPAEIDNCQGWLLRQVELIEPKVICTLGNFSTKLLRGEPTGITRLHGRDEERVIGLRRVRLLPLFHPAAALYTAPMLETLRADFQRIPELLALPAPEQPEGLPEDAEELMEPVPEPAPEVEPGDEVRPDEPEVPAAEQIALF